MRIHTVREGDTVWNIARKYSVNPSIIIETNSLAEPDRLTIGEELVILTPTRTHTVRGGDSLSSLALRYGVTKESLISSNPSLKGDEKIRPGQILSIKYDAPTYGMGAANGMFGESCRSSQLEAALPYLTYITFDSARISNGRLLRLFSPKDKIELIRKHNCSMIMRISSLDATLSKSLTDDIINSANTDEYDGICLSLPRDKMEEHGFCELLLELKRELMNDNLLLLTELSCADMPSCYPMISEIADAVILKTEKEKLGERFEECIAGVLNSYAEEAECQKTMLSISSSAYDGDEEIELPEAMKTARRSGAEIKCDKSSLLSYFRYNKYRRGTRESSEICFESHENTKAKLNLIGELGYMGVSFDISRVPSETLMMFYTMFRSAKSSALRLNESCLEDN